MSGLDRAGTLAAPDDAAPAARSGNRAPRRPKRHHIWLGGRHFVTQGLPQRFWQDLYHLSMTVSWPMLFATLGAVFFTLNVLFASLYTLQPGSIANLNPPGFWGAFFFSVETSATVGFGDMHPQTMYGHAVASIEIFCSISSIALITGVMFARFSRPHARIEFARHAVIRPIDGQPTLMLRAANARQNVIIETSAHLRLIRTEVSSEGFRIRRILDLALAREHNPLFLLGWTLMHVIDETSPLAGETRESLAAADGALILTLTGIDETTGQELTARTVYPADSFRWNHAFRDMLGTDEDGNDLVDYELFHEVIPLPPRAGTDS